MIVGHPSRAVAVAEAPLLAAGAPLMDHAAFALATQVWAELRRRTVARSGPRPGARAAERQVVLLVGSGNNGGDALLAGARLARRGVRVTALAVGRRVHDRGAVTLRRAGGRVRRVGEDGTTVQDAVRVALAADVVLDAILGIGGLPDRPGLRGVAAEVVRALGGASGAGATGEGTAARPTVVAVDLPSGVGADDGRVPDPSAVLAADVTVTFGAVKTGLLLPPAAGYVGRLVLVELGLGLDPHPVPTAAVPAATVPATSVSDVVRRLEPADLVPLGLLSPPAAAAHKYTRGVLGVVAGTDEFPGAAVLATSGASATGVGMIRYVGPAAVAHAVLAAHPEVVTTEGRVQAWAVGPGLPAVPGDDLEPRTPSIGPGEVSPREHARRAVAEACGSPGSGLAEARVPVPAVVDAGGLALLPVRVPASVVVTPHAGELARLLRRRGHDVERADVEAEPLRWARTAHEETGATVLLKGAVTVVVGPGTVYAQDDATPWLATAGAGDVLTGVLGALLAAHADRVLDDPDGAAAVAATAALVHGLAARRASSGGPLTATDVARAVPATVASLLGVGGWRA